MSERGDSPRAGSPEQQFVPQVWLDLRLERRRILQMDLKSAVCYNQAKL